jgi:hypothetical protein
MAEGKPPGNARHLFAVSRFDGFQTGGDPIDCFTLTRGYWDEAEALAKAESLNASAPAGTRYFVRLVRVADEIDTAHPS